MYYLMVTQESIFDIRKTITIAGKRKFADMYDDHKFMVPRYDVITDEVFEEIIADGYATEEEALNADDMKKTLEDFIGDFFNQEYYAISEEDLRKSYEMVKKIYEKVAA